MNIVRQNLYHSRFVLAFMFGSGILSFQLVKSHLVHNEVFGRDGNGGHMLKIITDLTDEEIAKLKFTKRLHWHMPTEMKMTDSLNTISDQELNDRGIVLPQEKYIEYNKRPPHDKYL